MSTIHECYRFLCRVRVYNRARNIFHTLYRNIMLVEIYILFKFILNLFFQQNQIKKQINFDRKKEKNSTNRHN